MQICKAFKQAQLGVRISHGEIQANIFKLLLSQSDKVHKCNKFGPFPNGKSILIENTQLILKNNVPKVPSLRGRQKDMYRLIEKILSPKHSRLLTLMGLPGVGKSSLVANTLDYVVERKLLKAGSIYLDIRNMNCPEEFL